MTNPFWLTVAATIMTFRGDVPLETWLPLIKDIAYIIIGSLSNILEVLL